MGANGWCFFNREKREKRERGPRVGANAREYGVSGWSKTACRLRVGLSVGLSVRSALTPCLHTLSKESIKSMDSNDSIRFAHPDSTGLPLGFSCRIPYPTLRDWSLFSSFPRRGLWRGTFRPFSAAIRTRQRRPFMSPRRPLNPPQAS